MADIIERLGEYGITPAVVDPWANAEEARREYGVDLVDLKALHDLDCIILAVAHKEFQAIGAKELMQYYRQGPNAEKVLIDVKGIYNIAELKALGLAYWRL